MRALPNVALGLAAGVVGALVAGHLHAADSPAPPTASTATSANDPRAAQPRMIVPPNWDRRYVQPSEPEAPTAPTAPAPPSDRQQDKLAHYQAELATRESRLADHEREALDASWATTSADRLRDSAADAGANPRSIDCRSTTCVVTLEFASPSDALAFLRSTRMSKLVGGFSAMTATPTPPTSEGVYELSVVLDRAPIS
jgi:hypothetical protein